jgi:hypothetical protein
MTSNITDTLGLIADLFHDLPKNKAELSRYTDSHLELIEALHEGLGTLRERCLEERGIRPSLKISGQVHEDILAEAARQARRNRN